jgi:undecaprenyl-diphosphatase
MTIIQSIFLGIIQGITEFLPISSSAHLVITPYLLGWKINEQSGFVFDVLVQLGTLLAVIVYFRKDLLSIVTALIRGVINKRPLDDQNSRLGWFLILATIPAVILGLLLKDQVEHAFSSPIATALFLLVTAIMLLCAERFGKKSKDLSNITWLDALVVGIFQAISIFPGISRSGSTISGGMYRDMERTTAARFSFLLSIPAMIGAGSLAFYDLVRLPDFLEQTATLLAGFITSAVVGYLSIHWLLGYLNKRPLVGFAGYCVVIATIVIFVFVFRSF